MEARSVLTGFRSGIATGWHKRRGVNTALTMNAILLRRSLTLSHMARHLRTPDRPRMQTLQAWAMASLEAFAPFSEQSTAGDGTGYPTADLSGGSRN
jgi:hypothetical protein